MKKNKYIYPVAEAQIRRTIKEHNLINRGDHIIIGLSGGPDSVCLFYVLYKMSDELNLTLHPVHLNHKFRPGAAERDQLYVEKLCQQLGVSEQIYTVDCNALAAKLKMTSEEAGRKARYDAFFESASKTAKLFSNSNDRQGFLDFAYEHVKIAVAHNANDQAETILFRLLRGVGTDGLAGMAYERREAREGEIYRVIRPLLDTWRKDIESYCAEMKLNPAIDHTNNEPIYSRNKLRLDLIPYIEENYNANIQEGLLRLGHIASLDKDFFRQKTEDEYNELRLHEDAAGIPFNETMRVFDREGLANCHEAVRHRIIFKAFSEIGLTRDITAERLSAADAIIAKKQGAKTVEFPHGHRLSVSKGRVTLI